MKIKDSTRPISKAISINAFIHFEILLNSINFTAFVRSIQQTSKRYSILVPWTENFLPIPRSRGWDRGDKEEKEKEEGGNIFEATKEDFIAPERNLSPLSASYLCSKRGAIQLAYVEAAFISRLEEAEARRRTTWTDNLTGTTCYGPRNRFWPEDDPFDVHSDAEENLSSLMPPPPQNGKMEEREREREATRPSRLRSSGATPVSASTDIRFRW